MTWPSPEVVERAAEAIRVFEGTMGGDDYLPWYRDMARTVFDSHPDVDALVAAAERRGRVAALREVAEDDTLADCVCGHDLGGEHNSLGCYARISYEPFVVCECALTDDRTYAALVSANLRARADEEEESR